MIPLSINGRQYELDEKEAVFQGAEGRLFRLHDFRGKLLKVYKTEIDFPGSDLDMVRARKMAANRGRLLYKKLSRLPPMPEGIVEPDSMILSDKDTVGALLLPEIENGVTLDQLKDREWRKKKKYSVSRLANLFLKMRALIKAVHKLGGVFGDLKPSNIIVVDDEVFFIDIESIAIAGCPATGFTWEYADPDWVGSPLQQENAQEEVEIPQPTQANDWYSFAVIYFETLTGVHPFAGVHIPVAPEEDRSESGESAMPNAVPPEERMVKRLSVLSEAENIVLRPAARNNLKILNSSEVAYFRRIFEGSTRGSFNKTLLESRVKKTKKRKKKTKPAGVPALALNTGNVIADVSK